MTSGRFVYVWQYTIKPEHTKDFLAAYEPNGEWARLFSRDPAYIATMLLRDDEDENRYVTVDFWRSKVARDAFRESYSVEFDTLDSRCERLTEKEQFLGDFHEAGSASG